MKEIKVGHVKVLVPENPKDELRIGSMKDVVPTFMNNKRRTSELIRKEQATPPRPGLVFDRVKHRWIRPKYGKEKYEVNLPQEIKEMNEYLDRLKHRKPQLKELGEKLDAQQISKIKDNVDEYLGQYERFFDAETYNKVRSISYRLVSSISRFTSRYTPDALQDLVFKSIDCLIYCEARSWERQLSDHGIRHIWNDIDTANRIFDAISSKSPKNPITNREVMMANLILIFHDIGYTAGPVRESIAHTKQHQIISRRWFEYEKEFFKKYFSNDELDFMADIIQNHDTTVIDWENHRLLTTVSLSDNLSLFHEEKLPSLFRYVPGSLEVLFDLKDALEAGDEKAEDRARELLDKKIDESYLPEYSKAWLKQAAKGINPYTVKVTIPMLIGRIRHFDWEDSGLVVDIDESPFDTKVAHFFDMGQRKYQKFAEDYGIDLKDNDNIEFVKDGKKVLTLKIRRSPEPTKIRKKSYDVMKVMSTPPRPGLVFDRTRRRWIRPNKDIPKPKQEELSSPSKTLLNMGAKDIFFGKKERVNKIVKELEQELKTARDNLIGKQEAAQGEMLVDEWCEGSLLNIYGLRFLAAKISEANFSEEEILEGTETFGLNDKSLDLLRQLSQAKFLIPDEHGNLSTDRAENILKREKAFAEKRARELFGDKIKVYRAVYGEQAEQILEELEKSKTGEASFSTMPLASYSQDRDAAVIFAHNNSKGKTSVLIEREIGADEIQFAWFSNPVFLYQFKEQFEVTIAPKEKTITLSRDSVTKLW